MGQVVDQLKAATTRMPFDAVKQIVGCGGSELHLTTNFRSLGGVIEPVNELFAAPDSCWAASMCCASKLMICLKSLFCGYLEMALI